MRVVLLLASLAVLAVLPLQAQAPRARVDVARLGPQIGDRVPDFTLRDQTGTERTLESIMGSRGAMLVFVRSADWCPFCRTQLVELQRRVEELRTRGIGLAAISYDSQEILADFARRHRITYTLLSDVGSATIKRYGIVNTVIEEALGPNGKDPAVLADLARYVTVTQAAERYRGIPFPGTFMLDRRGRVTARFFEDYYWERNTVSNVMLRVGGGSAPVDAIRASTQHLDLTAYPSDATAALGNRFSLVVDVTPKRGMHVYAPGATWYRVVTLNIDARPHLRTTPASYPPSEIYHFKPLNERVPVYKRPFTLRVEVVPEATAEARKALSGKTELAITGSLDYQACDDRICYNPVSLPLSWKIVMQANVAGAAPAQSAR
ncbi:MAG: redoxin domain-containing protein [Vicinamibacterales bacterium]